MDIVNVYRGDTPTLICTLTNADGSAIDLTGYSQVKLMAKRSPDDLDAAAVFSVNCTVDSPATLGKCRATLSAANLATAGDYLAEVEVRWTTGVILTAVQFTLRVLKDVYRG